MMEKVDRLLNWFRDKDGVIVAFSGGVDSSVVAKAAFDVLGDNALAVTAKSSTLAKSEFESAKRTAKEIGIKHLVIEEDELEDPRFVKNPAERCYYCREGLIKALKKIADERNIRHILDGANADDPLGHRPGLKALREYGAEGPLLELGFGKEDVREMALQMGLSVYDKPSMACLASRIPYGEEITKTKLDMIEKAEDFLRGLEFRQVRVRCYGEIGRIEVLERDLEKAIELRKEISKELRELGFKYITLDLEGYRSGSMDEIL
ncbi:MAG: ATP-dependent sacrificial sulfur transferase LarE [Candidatus Hydrothermarchaeales archaeon]